MSLSRLVARVFTAVIVILIAALAMDASHQQPVAVSRHGGSGPPASPQVQPETATLALQYARLPLAFERNGGVNGGVKGGLKGGDVEFMARGAGYSVFLTQGGDAVVTVLSTGRATDGPDQRPSAGCLPRVGDATPTHAADRCGAERDRASRNAAAAVRVSLAGSNRRTHARGDRQTGAAIHYVTPATHRPSSDAFARVAFDEVYDGIDLVYYGDQRQLEYDFIVHPGASPAAIAMQVEGADRLDVDAHGDLVLQVGSQRLVQRKPVVYQEINGTRAAVDGQYALATNGRVGFRVGRYDLSRPLVIDPVLAYSTYLGGSLGDVGTSVAVDATGNAYVTGYTPDVTFPSTLGAFDPSANGGYDAFVAKLAPGGNALVYATYFGGTGDDQAQALAIDATGSVYVTGFTRSTDFPTTAGAFDRTANGDWDSFVAKFSPSGAALVYSTLIGGTAFDWAQSIALDASGSAYVAGYSESTDYPTTVGAFDRTPGGSYDAFVTKVTPNGGALAYSTYVGGLDFDLAFAIAVDVTGSVYVTGDTQSFDFPTTAGAFSTRISVDYDVFVAKLNPAGSSLVYSTYIGGDRNDVGLGLTIDGVGNAYVAGYTMGSSDYPTTAGAFDTTPSGATDAFVTRLDAAGATLVYSTLLGGTDNDFGQGIAIDPLGRAYVSGFTLSTDFPVTGGAVAAVNRGGFDSFVTKLDATGAAVSYSTYLGGVGDDFAFSVATDGLGSAFIAGYTSSADFPTTTGAFDQVNAQVAVFVARLADAGAPAVLMLTPTFATSAVGLPQCATATIEDAIGSRVPNVAVRWSVTGANVASGAGRSDAGGQFTICYVGTRAGTDTLSAFADTNNNGTRESAEPQGTATRDYLSGVPAALRLTSATPSQPLGGQACVDAVVVDAAGNGVADVLVRFAVSGSVATTGQLTTNGAGRGSFCYDGPALPGADAIAAFADVDRDAVRDANEPTGAAARAWVLPSSTARCEVVIREESRAVAANGDLTAFAGRARSLVSGLVVGYQRFTDRGPVTPRRLRAARLETVVCNPQAGTATVYGRGRVLVPGVPPTSDRQLFRIDVTGHGRVLVPDIDRDSDVDDDDRDSDGVTVPSRYRIRLESGYDSGVMTVQHGRVIIRQR